MNHLSFVVWLIGWPITIQYVFSNAGLVDHHILAIIAWIVWIGVGVLVYQERG